MEGKKEEGISISLSGNFNHAWCFTFIVLVLLQVLYEELREGALLCEQLPFG
jgi:hypothetical protein